jgi:acyl-CoA-dependent ceramide synthase
MATATRKRSNSVKEVFNELDAKVSVPPASANKPATFVPSGPLVWLVKPAQTLQVVLAVVAAWAAVERFAPGPNPLTPFLFISYPLSQQPGDNGEQKYGKGLLDLAFLSFYIIVFSFVRQSITEYLIRPLARNLGLKSESKVVRFMEQAYAVVYFSASGAFGLASFPFFPLSSQAKSS